MPTPQKTRTSFDSEKFQHSEKTLKYQRTQFKIQNNPKGITCEIHADQAPPAPVDGDRAWPDNTRTTSPEAAAWPTGPGRDKFACNSPAHASYTNKRSLKFRAFHRAVDCRHQGIACDIGRGLSNDSAIARGEAGPAGQAEQRADAPNHPSATGCRRCEGRRRVRRARAGFEARRRTK